MAGDIVPIELGLTDGNLVTLWAPRWREGDDEWEAFLGHGDDLYAFPSVPELVAFVRSGADNDLVEHEAWPIVSKLAASEFEPAEPHTYDLVGVPELVADDPDPVSVSELQDTFDIVSILGDVCDIDVVTKFFEREEIDTLLQHGVSAFRTREGLDLWNRIGTAVAQDWDAVIDALDAVMTTPDVDAAVVAEIESEFVAVDENEVEADDTVEDVDADDEYEFIDGDDEDDGYEFWGRVGIDPIRIITTDGTWYSLRCYVNDDAVFLGHDGTIDVFPSERALARHLADNHDHDLATLEPYTEIQLAAVDPDQLELAVELFVDAANFADDESTDAALAASTDLGSFVNYAIEPDSGHPVPKPPFDAEALAWRELEREFEARLRRH